MVLVSIGVLAAVWAVVIWGRLGKISYFIMRVHSLSDGCGQVLVVWWGFGGLQVQ